MGKNENGQKNKSFYQTVALANEGVTEGNVKSMILWYDLLSYALPFQLLFILVAKLGVQYYGLLLWCIFFIWITDTVIVSSLKKDGKNYQKFNKHIPLVKIWAVPVLLMAIATTVCLAVISFNLI